MSAAGNDLYGFLSDDDGEYSDLAGSGIRNHDASSTSRSLPSARKGRPERLGGGHNPSFGEDGQHLSTDRGDYHSSLSRRRKTKDREWRARREVDSEMDLALLSDDDDDDASHAVEKKRPSRLIPSNPTVAECLSAPSGAVMNDRHQQGDAVEARFGGRSKWFTGKVKRAYEDPLGKVVYDIAYDDGDNEDGVLAGRVRSPGQSSPPLRASLAVEVKLARKGKGYHPATIGRVNDDGSLYVKLEDGDSEWSALPGQVIPLYPFEPAKYFPSSSDTASPDPHRHDAAEGAGGGVRGDGDGDGDEYGGARKATPTADGKQVSNMSAAVEEEGAPIETPPPPTDVPVPTNESVGTDQERLPGTTSSNPATTASASRGSTPTDSSVHRKGVLVRPEPPDSVSILAVAASAPRPDDEEQAGARGASRVVAAANPDDRSVAKSIPRPDAVEPPYAGGLGGVTRAIKKSAGGSTVLSPGVQETPQSASTAGGISLLPYPETLHNAAATATTPPDAAAGHVDAASCDVVNKTGSWESASASAHPGLKPTAGGLSSGSVPVSADADRAAVSLSADAAREDETSNPTLAAFGVVGVVGAPDTLEAQRAGGDDTIITAGERGTCGVIPAAESRTDREEIPHPVKTGSGAEAIPEGADIHRGDDRRSLEYPDAAQGGVNTSTAHQLPPETTVQPGGDSTEPLNTVESVKEKGAKSGHVNHGTPSPMPQPATRDCGGYTQWENLRLSVQRRYAAEAMHLSEEVRLLKAKLNAADDQLQAKLAQQERRFGEQMQDALQRERDKAQVLLSRQRAASTRRISALSEELKAARRQLDLQKTRRTKQTGCAQKPPCGRAGPGPSLHPAGRRVHLRSPRREEHTHSYDEDEFVDFTADGTAKGVSRATRSRPGGAFTTTPSLGLRESGSYRPPSMSRSSTESRGEGAEIYDVPKISSLGCGDGPGGVRPTVTGGGMSAVAPTIAAADKKNTVADGLAPGSEMVDFLSAGLASTNQSVGELAARLEKLERGRGGEGALGAESTAGCRMRLAGDGYRDPSGDRAAKVDRGKSVNNSETHRLPSHPPTSRCQQEAPGSEEDAPAVGKFCGGRSHEGSVTATATAAATAAAVVLESDDAGDLILPGSRRACNSNPSPAKSHAGNPSADICYEKPSTITNNSTAVWYEHTGEEDLRWKLETERRNVRERLKAMKGEVERVVGQFRARAERAEAAAASAEKRATVKALQYLRSKRQSPPLSPPLSPLV